ncbi:MAG: ABC transporter substrate-binding protein [Dehalococcoidia bacterium]|nr:ABC transporter substrate-binding protein [Dehalococcoidia bacterium]
MLRITTIEPFAPFLTIHASTPEGVWFIPVETINNDQVQTAPVGTGPRVFDEWETGVAMRWSKHDNFHMEGRPYTPNVEAALFNDPQRIIAALQSGDFDWSNLSGSVYESAHETLDPEGIEAFSGAGAFGAFYFNFDNDGGRWRDTRLRQALSMAMNRAAGLDTLDQTGRGDFSSPCCASNLAPYFLSPMSEDYGENAKFLEYNAAEAQALIQAATGSDRVQTRVTANVDRYGAAYQQIWEFYAAQMAEAGFDIELNYQEYGSYIQSTYLGDIPEGIGFGPLIGSPRDPNDILSRNLESSSARHNWGGTPIDEMERIDEMIAEQRSIPRSRGTRSVHPRHAARDGGVHAGGPVPRLGRVRLRQPVGPELELEERLCNAVHHVRQHLVHRRAHRSRLDHRLRREGHPHGGPPAAPLLERSQSRAASRDVNSSRLRNGSSPTKSMLMTAIDRIYAWSLAPDGACEGMASASS